MEQSHPNPLDMSKQAGMIDAVVQLQIKSNNRSSRR